jgi:hypothetical protein
MSHPQRITACLVAALMTLPVVYGFMDPALPVWGLFRRFDRYDYALVDADGRSYRFNDYVQRRAYFTCDHRLVSRFAFWLVESGHARAPLWGRSKVWDDGGLPAAQEFRVELRNGVPQILAAESAVPR